MAIVDDDSGLHCPDDGNLAFYTNKKEQVRIDSSGNVGIGTDSPQEQLHVAKNVEIDGNLTTKGKVEIDDTLTAKNVEVDGNLTAKTDIQVDGNLTAKGKVEIDDTLTAKTDVEVDGKLHVAGDVQVDGTLSANSYSGFYFTEITSSTDDVGFRRGNASRSCTVTFPSKVHKVEPVIGQILPSSSLQFISSPGGIMRFALIPEVKIITDNNHNNSVSVEVSISIYDQNCQNRDTSMYYGIVLIALVEPYDRSNGTSITWSKWKRD